MAREESMVLNIAELKVGGTEKKIDLWMKWLGFK